MSRRAKPTDHVIMIPDGGVGCAHCGAAQPIAYPVSIPVLAAISESFTKLHKACKKGPGGEARYSYSTPDAGQRAVGIREVAR